nr:uncharacterized mitochondrial protein AtMg00810-like [Tanacetum cinerariifolium]
IDVKSAFLYVKIKEEVYVCQPLGFEDLEFTDRVYKVEKALYGLYQAPRAWYETLSTDLLDNGFYRGLQVTQKHDGIFISQDKYVNEILKKFGFSTMKLASTPMETSKPLLKDENAKDVDVHLYRLMIGSLIYLTSSRLDIMFVVCACARFQVTPKGLHLYVVKRFFRYLKGQPKLGLWYLKDLPFELEDYTDNDYAGASLDRKSTTREYVAASNGYGQETATARTLNNGEIEITATIDGKVKNVTEASVRRHLKLADSDGISSLPTTDILEQLSLMGIPIRQETEVPQPSSPPHTNVADKAASTGVDVRHGGATTNVTGLEARQGSDDLEDSSKQRWKIAAIDQYPAISLVQHDVEIQGRNRHDIKEDCSQRQSRGKMVKSKTVQPKIKLQQEQERLSLEAAMRLQAQIDEKERQRISRVHEIASSFNIKEWEDMQASVKDDEELAMRLQAKERENYTKAKKARMLAEFIIQIKFCCITS